MGIRREELIASIAVLAFLLGVIFFYSMPLTWLILSSIDPKATPEFRIPPQPSLENYVRLVEPVGEVPPYKWILNSLIIASSSATLTMLVSLLAAFVFTRYSFRGQQSMLTAFVIFRLIPPLLIALPLMTLFRMWGLMDSVVALIFVLSALVLPFTLLMMESYFRAIPITYEEAAMIDGCSKLGAFLRVTLPLAAPGLVSVWLLAFVYSWSEFIIPLVIMRSVDLMPASVGLYYFFGQYGRIEYGKISAFSIVYAFPMVLVFFATQKYLRRGIAGLVSR
ncbi:MAG TPA: carbohydrate ABC transporter permease [Desulfurococcaceae archaeon]|nr:carbohydrate ABC transporter permease [Desulfurococcaceae archaeon]